MTFTLVLITVISTAFFRSVVHDILILIPYICRSRNFSVLPKQNLKHDWRTMVWAGPTTTSKLRDSPHFHIKKISTEGLLGQHALCILGRTLNFECSQKKFACPYPYLYKFSNLHIEGGQRTRYDHTVVSGVSVHSQISTHVLIFKGINLAPSIYL